MALRVSDAEFKTEKKTYFVFFALLACMHIQNIVGLSLFLLSYWIFLNIYVDMPFCVENTLLLCTNSSSYILFFRDFYFTFLQVQVEIFSVFCIFIASSNRWFKLYSPIWRTHTYSIQFWLFIVSYETFSLILYHTRSNRMIQLISHVYIITQRDKKKIAPYILNAPGIERYCLFHSTMVYNIPRWCAIHLLYWQ